MGKGKKIGIIGAGFIGSAIVRGLYRSDFCSKENMIASDVDYKNRMKKLKSEGVDIVMTGKNKEVVEFADIVILAVKPDKVYSILSKFKEMDLSGKLFISVAAGVKLSALESIISDLKVVRVMPNLSVAVLSSVTAITGGLHTTRDDIDEAKEIFDLLGTTVEVSEDLFDPITALSGAGPGYLFLFMEAMIDAGVLVGIPRDLATLLVKKSTIGAAILADRSKESMADMKAAVTSAGGVTITGIKELEKVGMRGSIMTAVELASKKAIELGRGIT